MPVTTALVPTVVASRNRPMSPRKCSRETPKASAPPARHAITERVRSKWVVGTLAIMACSPSEKYPSVKVPPMSMPTE